MQAKKILIITYYWPPSGGPGVQRWLKFVKYLPDFGWQPTVFIPENPSYPIVDESLANEVDKNLETIKTKIWEPYQLAEIFGKDNKKFKAGQFDVGENQSWKSKLSIWVRGNFFIPDARIFWVKPSVKFLKKYLKENDFDAFVTTGPPHSLHLIGLQLKKEFPNLKWIADFRDPWTEISYYKHLKLTKSADKKHRDLEQKVFKNADITLATSYTDAENFRKKGANAVCITNGFDESQEPRNENQDSRAKKREPRAETPEPRNENRETTTEIQDSRNESREPRTENQDLQTDNRQPITDHPFTISYIGVLEQLRNPEILWEVLDELVVENEDFKNDFQLKFVGKIDDKILNKIENTNLKNSIKNLGYRSHSEANAEMQNSDLLLITNFPDETSKGIIPGKIFEYIASGNTIISFGPKDADVAKILDKTKAGKHFSYDEKEGVKDFILEKFNLWKHGNLTKNHADIEEFSRKNLTKKLVQIMVNY